MVLTQRITGRSGTGSFQVQAIQPLLASIGLTDLPTVIQCHFLQDTQGQELDGDSLTLFLPPI
jgi:hypothetical protein